MNIGSLLVLACVGGIVLGAWDLTRHVARDVLKAMGVFLSGMLVGATAFVLLPEPIGVLAFAGAAAASSFASWKHLDHIVRLRTRSFGALEEGSEDPVEALLALHERADGLESHRRNNWLGPVLAFVFAMIIGGWGVQGEELAVIAAAIVMAVPFGRLARHHVETMELRELGRLVRLNEGGGLPPPDVEPK